MYAGSPKHPIFSGSTFGLMSGEKPLFKPQIDGGHEALGGILSQMGLHAEETSGKYKDPERSYIIHNPTLDQMRQLGKMFGQESVVFSSNGQHRLVYTNGEHEGKYHGADHQNPLEHFEQPPPDFYTKVPGHGYARINFDWNQMHPVDTISKKETQDRFARLIKAKNPALYPGSEAVMDQFNEQGAVPAEPSAGLEAIGSPRMERANFQGNSAGAKLDLASAAFRERLQESANRIAARTNADPDAIEQIAWHDAINAGTSRDPQDPNYSWHNYQNMPGVHDADTLGPHLNQEAGLPFDGTATGPALDNGIPSKDEMQAAWKHSPAHPHAYDWHDGHTDHHEQDLAGPRLPGLMKADPQQPANDQAAGVGVSTYKQFALPYGQVAPGQNSNLLHYPYHGKLPQIEKLVADHGYKTYYAGGKYGKPDLANKNYNTGHLMVYDPTPASGGDFGEEEYTKGWRQIHELAHALTYPELNKIYGEGRRIGKLGTHRTMNEALRAVHWEWLAAHKQRELSEQIGIKVPDETFNRELNTVMHDAAHRAVTGKFTEPSQEGFIPHGRKVPLHTALQLVRDSGHQMGLTGLHDTIKKPLAKSELKKALPKGAKLDPQNPGDQTQNIANQAGFPNRHPVAMDAVMDQGFSPTKGYATKRGLGTRLNAVPFDDRKGRPVESGLPARAPSHSHNGAKMVTPENIWDYMNNMAIDGAPLTADAIRHAVRGNLRADQQYGYSSAAVSEPSDPEQAKWGVRIPGRENTDRIQDEMYWNEVNRQSVPKTPSPWSAKQPEIPQGVPAPDVKSWRQLSPILKRTLKRDGQLPPTSITEAGVKLPGTKKSELAKSLISPAAAGATRAPQLHNSVEGFMAGLKALPKGTPERGKFITSHMSHPDFLGALQKHPQGKQIHAMLTQHLNSVQNAGLGNGAKAVVKSLKSLHENLKKTWPKEIAPADQGGTAPGQDPAAGAARAVWQDRVQEQGGGVEGVPTRGPITGPKAKAWPRPLPAPHSGTRQEYHDEGMTGVYDEASMGGSIPLHRVPTAKEIRQTGNEPGDLENRRNFALDRANDFAVNGLPGNAEQLASYTGNDRLAGPQLEAGLNGYAEGASAAVDEIERWQRLSEELGLRPDVIAKSPILKRAKPKIKKSELQKALPKTAAQNDANREGFYPNQSPVGRDEFLQAVPGGERPQSPPRKVATTKWLGNGPVKVHRRSPGMRDAVTANDQANIALFNQTGTARQFEDLDHGEFQNEVDNTAAPIPGFRHFFVPPEETRLVSNPFGDETDGGEGYLARDVWLEPGRYIEGDDRSMHMVSPETGKVINLWGPDRVAHLQRHFLPEKPIPTLKSETILNEVEGDTVSNKTYTVDEAKQILLKATQEKLDGFAKQIQGLRERELKKAAIPPHKHNEGLQAAGSAEDVPPSKVNGKGVDKSALEKGIVGTGGSTGAAPSASALPPPGPAMAMAEKPASKAEPLCKKCGKSHAAMAKCGDMEVAKADLVDSKGKRSDDHTVAGSKLPDDAKPKKINEGTEKDPGSGGIKLPGSNLKKSAQPPMAKPPSGKNMGTSVPTSAPKPPKAPAAPTMKSVDKMVVHGSKAQPAPKDADYKSKQQGDKAVYESKKPAETKNPSDLDKAALAPMPKLKAPDVKQGYAYEHDAVPTQVQPITPIPVNNPKRGAGPQATELAPGAWKPGQSLTATHLNPQTAKPLASPTAAGVTRKGELEKAVLAPGVKQQMQAHALHDASKAAAPQAPAALPPSPSPAQHADRAAGFAASMPGPTFQPQPLASPKAAGVTRAPATVQPKLSKPGIFGRLLGGK